MPVWQGSVLTSRGCLVVCPGDAWSAAGRPELTRAALGAFLARGPQLLASLGLLDADRLGLGHEQLDGLAGGHLLAHPIEAPGLAQPVEQLVHRGALTLGTRLERLADLLVGRLDVLGLDDRGQDGL